MLSGKRFIRNTLKLSLIIFADFISFYLSLILAYMSRIFLDMLFPHIFPKFGHDLFHYLFSPFFIFYIFILSIRGIYFRKNFFWEDVKEYILASIFYSFLLFSFLSLSRQIFEFSRAVLILHIFYLPFINSFIKYIFFISLINKLFPINVYYLGEKRGILSFEKIFLRDKYLGFRLSEPDKAEYIFISNRLPNYNSFLLNFQKNKRKVFILEEKHTLPPMLYKTHIKIGERYIVLEYENKLLDWFNLSLKRFIDYILSTFMLLLALPIMIIIAILIKIDSPGPVFYLHERIGRNGKKFKCIKFRTMYVDAEKRLKEILKDPKARREWEKYGKLKNDPRITRIGKFLRKTSLDELPQLFNVLKGDMSLVGPRPVTELELHKYYGKCKEYYLSVYPGITGLWQVSGRNKLPYHDRIYLDVWYVLNWSIWIDVVILLKTVKEVFKPSGW